MEKPPESSLYFHTDGTTRDSHPYMRRVTLFAGVALLTLWLITPLFAQDKVPSNPNSAIANSLVTNDNIDRRGPGSDKPAGIDGSVRNGWDGVSVWNGVVQTLTLIVVLFYTILTRRMQQVMARQIKLSVMPAFILNLVQTNMRDVTLDASTFILHITNIGSGTALNIEVGEVALQTLSEGRRKIGAPNLRFAALGILRRDETSPLKHHSYSGGQLVEEDFMIDLEEQIAKPGSAGVYLVITFQDIEGDQYQQEVRLSRVGCSPSAVRAI